VDGGEGVGAGEDGVQPVWLEISRERKSLSYHRKACIPQS
jgi:hypothetical protein